MLRIFVPTRDRADQQVTLDQWHLREMPYPVTLLVPDSQEREYRRHVGGNIDMVLVPDTFRFSDVRQYIVNEFREPMHVVLDDDLRLHIRVNGSLETARRADAVCLFNVMKGVMEEGYVHGGVNDRFMNQTKPDRSFNQKVVRAHFYRADVVRKMDFDFRWAAVAQDVLFCVAMMHAGWKNVVLNTWAHSHVSLGGGVKNYRTPELRIRCYEEIMRRYPGCGSWKMREKRGELRPIFTGRYAAMKAERLANALLD